MHYYTQLEHLVVSCLLFPWLPRDWPPIDSEVGYPIPQAFASLKDKREIYAFFQRFQISLVRISLIHNSQFLSTKTLNN